MTGGTNQAEITTAGGLQNQIIRLKRHKNTTLKGPLWTCTRCGGYLSSPSLAETLMGPSLKIQTAGYINIYIYIYTYSYYRIACLYTHYYIILYWDFTWYTLCFTRLYQTYFMILALHYVALQHVELYYTMSHHVPAYYLILYSIILLQFILH